MSEKAVKRLVMPGLLFISIVLAMIGFVLNILNEDTAFRVVFIAAFSIAGIYYYSLWKLKRISRLWNLLALLAIGFCLLMLILSFFNIHVIPSWLPG